jgi:4-amino-4-deoxy-L-arabinose transferase-like glycosyltransferase
MVPALVVALATLLRLAWVLVVPTKPVGDFAMYLESAAHVVEHGALDPEFVYMPGYVFVLALVQALGGGVLAAKIVGALLGGLATGPIQGLAARTFGPRAGLAAGLLYALWPAGIAVTSVTGTDLPTAVVVVTAAWCLVRWGPTRPALAAVLFGVVMGAAAWMRAVALPLAALSAVYFRAQGLPWRGVVRHTAVACLAAGLVLAPWAVRNRLRYGETFFTDSHGGLTALVGANPDTDGAYSRSLNRIFRETTGHVLLAEPHRDADRAAYAIARDWARFERPYAASLVVTKAGRLLGSQAPLLYWPIYRRGVLSPQRAAWFERHRRALERVVDGFWWLLAGAGAAGLGLAVARRNWVALAFLPLPLALAGIYALFFAEARYQLPIVVFLFPPAGAALVWLADSLRGRPRRSELVAAAVGLALVLAGWPALAWAGERLRDGHRWAAHVCHVGGQAVVCKWRRDDRGGDSGLRGVWNGLGVAAGKSARTEWPLPAGQVRVRAALDLVPSEPGSGTAVLRAGGAAVVIPLERLESESRAGRTVPMVLEVAHAGGPLVLTLSVEGRGPRVWLSDLRVEGP